MTNLDVSSCFNTLRTNSFRPFVDTSGKLYSIPLPGGFNTALAEAALSNVKLLSLLDVENATPNQLPTLFTLFDITMQMLEGLSLTAFITKFSPNKTEGNEYKQCSDVAKFLRDSGFSEPLGNSAIRMVHEYANAVWLREFFDKLLFVSSNMARLTENPNRYNDYRISQNIQAMFFLVCDDYSCCNEDGEPDDCKKCTRGSFYNYATGETMAMEKTLDEYQRDIDMYREYWLNPDARFKFSHPPTKES